jgi:SnoaL-like domain
MTSDSSVMRDDVLTLLRRFQDGYRARDVGALDDFMQLFADGAEVVGTSGVIPGGEEWCLGRDQIRELVRRDWEAWGDILFDVDRATMHVCEGTAWAAVPGVVSRTGEKLALRLTVVLVRNEGRWLIRQMHFSLATSDCRVIRSG